MRHSECRRRSEDGEAGDVEATSEDQEGNDNLVQLLPSQADLTDEPSSTDRAADRLHAMLSDIDAQFASRTELEPADETPVSEVERDLDDMIPAGVSTGDRRRRPPVAWPEKKPVNPTICKVRRTMKCKQRCPRGWKKVGAKQFGCCSSFASCGGHRKICEKTLCPLRRRAGDEGSLKGDE